MYLLVLQNGCLQLLIHGAAQGKSHTVLQRDQQLYPAFPLIVIDTSGIAKGIHTKTAFCLQRLTDQRTDPLLLQLYPAQPVLLVGEFSVILDKLHTGDLLRFCGDHLFIQDAAQNAHKQEQNARQQGEAVPVQGSQRLFDAPGSHQLISHIGQQPDDQKYGYNAGIVPCQLQEDQPGKGGHKSHQRTAKVLLCRCDGGGAGKLCPPLLKSTGSQSQRGRSQQQAVYIEPHLIKIERITAFKKAHQGSRGQIPPGLQPYARKVPCYAAHRLGYIESQQPQNIPGQAQHQHSPGKAKEPGTGKALTQYKGPRHQHKGNEPVNKQHQQVDPQKQASP